MTSPAPRRPARLLAPLALLAAACGSEPGTGSSAPAAADAPPPRPVVLLTVDTLRADALGCYGNADARTPHLDALARTARIYDRAYGQATITHPSLSSVLTGLLPSRHGVRGQAARLADGVVPLPVRLQAAGVPTASFVANLCKLQDQERTVFHDGWDVRFCGMDDALEQHEWDAAVVDAALAWMDGREGPFFAWIHLMDPHAEHRPPPDLWDYDARPVRSKDEQYHHFGAFEEARTMPGPEDRDLLWDLYAAEVEGVDRQVGRVLDALGAREDANEVALIVSSDHGEELYETWSRYDHGLSMTEGVLRVPLLLRAPEVAPGRVEAPVEIAAIAPTVLDLFGLEPWGTSDAPSLLAGPGREFALSFTGDVSVSLRTGEHRYWWRRTEEPFVRPPDEFPWRADAPWFQERECLADYPGGGTGVRWLDLGEEPHGAVAAELAGRLRSVAKELEGVPVQVIEDPDLLRQLEALGYAPDIAPED